MGDIVRRVLATLESAYCPPLDAALFAAIANDYDLSCESDVQTFQSTLDALKTAATEEENTKFDPSGTSGAAPQDDRDTRSSEAGLSLGTLPSLESNITSLESELSSLDVGEEHTSPSSKRNKSERSDARVDAGCSSPSDQRAAGIHLGDLDSEGKTAYLLEMFPSIDQYTVIHTLNKSGEDLDRCMDILLNIAFFEGQSNNNNDNGDDNEFHMSIPKGVDGFEEPIKSGKERKPGRRTKHHRGNSVLQNSVSNAIATANVGTSENKIENRWNSGKLDVEFICSRTYLSQQSVASAYHLHGARLPATIHFLVESESAKYGQTSVPDPVTSLQVAELREQFSPLSPEKLVGLLRLTRNSMSAATELANVVIAHADTPFLLRDSGLAINTIYPRGSVQGADAPKPSQYKLSNSTMAVGYTAAKRQASDHVAAGKAALAKANAAYRRGKSDHLMGGAASYYSALGREHLEKAKRDVAAAAESLVDSQSTETVLDLHGVSVYDAVNIASHRVEQWWDALGEAKLTKSGALRQPREGLHIVTGLGRHSRNGTAKLGPAVARMLMREGWKVEVAEGFMTVTGKVRHR